MRMILKLILLFIVIVSCSNTVFPQSDSIIDSLKTEIKKSNEDTLKIGLLNTLSRVLSNSGILDEAKQFAQKAIDLSIKMDYKKGLGDGNFSLGYANHYEGEYELAQKLYVKAMAIQESIGDKDGLSRTLTSMGIISIRFGNSDKSIEYYEWALRIKKELNDSIGIGALLNNLAVVYFQLEQFDKALDYMEKTRDIYEGLGNQEILGTILTNLGAYYYENGEIEKGRSYFYDAHKATMRAGNPYSISMSYNALSHINLELNNYDSALYLNNKALEYAYSAKAKDQIMSAYETYSDIFSQMENYEEAFEYQSKYISIKDSIFNSEKAQQITEIAEKYESEKKNQEIEFLKKDKLRQKAIDKAELARHQVILWFTIIGLAFVLVFAIFIYNRFKTTQKQKIVIENQKEIVDEKQKEITDSITYAKRIQEAILPPENSIKQLLPNSFFLYKPKDIVSGDFYWVEEANNKVLFAAVDCTGHGVPGAFVSIVGHNGLNRALNEFGLTEPAKILEKLNILVKETLRQEENEVRDGMDISLCSIDFSTNKLEYSGANNPLYLVRNGEIIITKADKQPIGGSGKEESYTNHEINLQEGDTLYLFSDGFADQFGGVKGKKFRYSQFRELLLSVQSMDMDAQLKVIDDKFESWKGNIEQIDDVCVIGVKI